MFVEDAVVALKSGMQRIVELPTVEAELIAMIQCVQDMMHVKKLIEPLELSVELPMMIECDNKGASERSLQAHRCAPQFITRAKRE